MEHTDFDFSDIFIQNPEWPRVPLAIPRLSETDSAVIRWFGRLVASHNDGTLQIEYVAWFVARMLSNGGILVWLAQDGGLLDSGLREIFAESAKLVPEPWAGFLRWSSDAGNLDSFRAWPPYTSEDNVDGYIDRPPMARRGKGSRRRR
ncbi:MAG: hypothetical protein QOJ79_3071 [Actinomycetota bacterium]|jgi:hypothetical protein|nr:hypothetical protein [Actinomycetota bacterium]